MEEATCGEWLLLQQGTKPADHLFTHTGLNGLRNTGTRICPLAPSNKQVQQRECETVNLANEKQGCLAGTLGTCSETAGHEENTSSGQPADQEQAIDFNDEIEERRHGGNYGIHRDILN